MFMDTLDFVCVDVDFICVYGFLLIVECIEKWFSKKKTGISLYRNKILWEFTRRINSLRMCYWYFVIYNLFYGCKFILLCNTFCECDTIIWVRSTWSFIDPSCVRGGQQTYFEWISKESSQNLFFYHAYRSNTQFHEQLDQWVS